MNRYTLPRDFEDAILQRAEHHERLGETSEAIQYRRFAKGLRQTKPSHPGVTGKRFSL